MKERPILFSAPMIRAIRAGMKTQTRRVVKPQPTGTHGVQVAQAECRYGVPGDRLWVRETWGMVIPSPGRLAYVYRADEGDGLEPEKWRPSIHMPRGACRIQLEVTEVRVQPLYAITTEDIIAEGLHTNLRGHDAVCDLHDQWQALWTRINGADSWNANPWVYAVSFRVR